jgi:dTDP-4-dehydrorhamnose reductase
LDQLDLTRPETVRQTLDRARPELVVHLAAMTAVDDCELRPQEAYAVNTGGTLHIARACAGLGARLVFLSSDYVFDGRARAPYREDHPTAPLNVYGRTKEEAERAVLALCRDALVVRSSGLFGEGGRHFIRQILEAARRGEALRVVDDQVQSPTWVGHLAPDLARAAFSRARGILHLSAGGECSWYEFARAALEAAGIEAPIRAVSSAEYRRPATRPAYSVLDNALAAETLGGRLPHWREGLAAYASGGFE